MQRQLTWDDLLIQPITSEEAKSWLSNWSWLLSGKFFPICMSKFGDWFIRRPDGATEELSVIEGTLVLVARTPAEFDEMMNQPEWQEVHLCSQLVRKVHDNNLIPAKGQCYGFSPHPLWIGKIDPESVVLLDIPIWQSICSQSVASRSSSPS